MEDGIHLLNFQKEIQVKNVTIKLNGYFGNDKQLLKVLYTIDLEKSFGNRLTPKCIGKCKGLLIFRHKIL